MCVCLYTDKERKDFMGIMGDMCGLLEVHSMKSFASRGLQDYHFLPQERSLHPGMLLALSGDYEHETAKLLLNQIRQDP